MANRKYLFFADVAKQLDHKDLAKLFRDTAAQETEHAFAHFRLLHPELVVSQPDQLSDDEKQAILSRCLKLAIEGDPDSGIAAGTPFEAIPDDWQCPICGARKASFVPYREAELKAA